MPRDGIPLIKAYFRTHAARDEPAHLALFDFNVRYFGSISGVRDTGIPTYLGIFRGVANQFRMNEVTPRRVLGTWPEYVVVADMNFQPPGEILRVLESIWHFVFNDAGLIQELGIFYAPSDPVILEAPGAKPYGT